MKKGPKTFGKPILGICSNCELEKLIVKKSKKLCQHCLILTKKSKKLKSSSSKNNKSKKEIKEVYSKIDSVEENGFCSSCGSPNLLSHSHLVPQSYNKPLATCEDNIIIQCLNCHSEWERREWKKVALFPNFYDIFERIRLLDESYYNIINSQYHKYLENDRKDN